MTSRLKSCQCILVLLHPIRSLEHRRFEAATVKVNKRNVESLSWYDVIWLGNIWTKRLPTSSNECQFKEYCVVIRKDTQNESGSNGSGLGDYWDHSNSPLEIYVQFTWEYELD